MALALAITGSQEGFQKQLAEHRAHLEKALSDSSIKPIWKWASVSEAQLVFFCADDPKLEEVLPATPRAGKAFVLLVDDTDPKHREFAAEVFHAGLVDDLVVLPARPLELLAKFKRVEQVLLWEEVRHLNFSFQDVLGKIREDLEVAERLQVARSPMRFPEVKGFKVTHRYLAGLKSGGDHFDLAESRDGKLLSFVLTDASSYGLSSAVLSALMRVTVQLTRDELHSSSETVLKIEKELAQILGERDKLSIFYGTVSRKDFKLRFVNLGQSAAFYAPQGGSFTALEHQGAALSKAHMPPRIDERSLELDALGRLILLSDGFVETLGGVDATVTLLNKHRGEDSQKVLNEIVFRVKSELESSDDLPAQDCTAALFDVDRGVLRLKAS